MTIVRRVLEGTTSVARRQLGIVPLLLILGGFWLFPALARATHYPPGSSCYDCHALSQSRMVAGTHLIKKSQKTVDLGITETSPVMRCLFCHEEYAVSVASRTVMKGVMNHFNSLSASSHAGSGDEMKLSALGENPAKFDCLDCHPNIVSVGVVSDTEGNANVHGFDASAAVLPVASTLIGSPTSLSDSALTAAVCPSCHASGADTPVGDQTAKRAHGFTVSVTIQSVLGVRPAAYCTECHGKHNSYQGASLIVLRTSGSVSNNPTDAISTLVTPDKCGNCHSQDDGDAASDWKLRGHGKSTVLSGAFRCANCHDSTVGHDFLRAGSNANRFFPGQEGGTTSLLTKKNAYSICLTCHSTYTGKAHTTKNVGCVDCHEPHGTGVGANIKMVRTQLPADYTDDTNGVPGDVPQPVDGTISFTGPSGFYNATGTGVCDNVDCHGGLVRNTANIQPLSSFLSGGKHSAGDLPVGYDCSTCHTHLAGLGAWMASDSTSCTLCHGQPPTGTSTTAEGYTTFSESRTPHQKHAVDYSFFTCRACHLNNASGAWHNTGGLAYNSTTKTWSWTNKDNASYQSLYFDRVRNPTPTSPPPLPVLGTPPFDRDARYDIDAHTCASLYCHSDGQAVTSINPASPVLSWMSDVSENWSTKDLGCNACHGRTTSTAVPLTYGAPDHTNAVAVGDTPNSHDKHVYRCSVCHYGTIRDTDETNGWTLFSPITLHVDGKKDITSSTEPGAPSFADARSDGGTPKTCKNISCHNGGSAKWGTLPQCSDCHFGVADIDNWNISDKIPAALSSTEWTAAGHGRPTGSYPSGNAAAALAGPAATDLQGCGYCHNFSVTHGTATNPFRLANKGILARGTTEDGGWNDLCLTCHMTGKSGYTPPGGGYTARNGAKKVDANHYGAKHAGAPSKGGTFCWDCHDPHGDTSHYMMHSGNGLAPRQGVTVTSDGLYGVPVTSRIVTDLRVDDGYNSDDLAKLDYTGLCQTCHASSGGANYYNQLTYTTLANHQGADILRCTLCHLHTTEFTPSCTGCHGGGLVAESNRNWWPDSTLPAAASPQRLGSHTNHVSAIARVKAGTVSPTVDDKNGTCAYCHPTGGHSGNAVPPAEVADGTAGKQFKDVAGRLDTGGARNFVDASTVYCTNVDCHYNGKGNVATGTPNWYGGAVDCESCHFEWTFQSVTGATYAPGSLPNAHDVHTDDSTYAFSCYVCHPLTFAMWHQNGVVDLAYDPSRIPLASDADAVFTGGNRAVKYGTGAVENYVTCENFYCHGDRTGGNKFSPNWFRTDAQVGAGLGDGVCGTCHGSTAGADNVQKSYPRPGATSPTGESHAEHVSSNSKPGCSACHAGAGTVGLGTYGAYTNHVKGGTVDLAFGYAKSDPAVTVQYENLPVYPLASAWSSTNKTCSNIRCHNGVTTPAFTLSGGTNIECGDCHGGDFARRGNPSPNSVSTAGSHAAHGSATDYTTCDNCHGNGMYNVSGSRGGSAYTVTGGGGTSPNGIHQDLSVNFYMNGVTGTYTDTNGIGGVNYLAGSESPAKDNGTCAATACHGGTTPQWGGVLVSSCYVCHDTNGATLVENGGVLGGAANSLANEVDQGQYESTGHGRATGKYGKHAMNDGLGNTGANLAVGAGCYQCHDSDVAHVPAAPSSDPFRLGTKATVSGTQPYNPSNVCLQAGTCHGPDLPGVINHHNDTVINNSGTSYSFDVKCIDCHDPHGDSNLYMIHDQVAVDGVDVETTQTQSNTYGVPDATRLVVFPTDNTGADFANTNPASSGPFTGICEVCHANTKWYQGTNGAAKNGPRTDHEFTGNCMDCHPHKYGFKGGGCDTCHGFPPIDASQTPVVRKGKYQERVSTVPSGYAEGGGTHRTHVNLFWKKLDPAYDPTSTTATSTTDADPKVICGPCHGDKPGTATWHNEGGGAVAQTNVDIRTRDILGFSWGTEAKYEVLNMDAPNTGGHVTSGGNQRCANLDCHGKPNPAKNAFYSSPQNQSTENQRAHMPEELFWRDVVVNTTDGTGKYQVSKKTVVCKWCHDETPARVVLPTSAGSISPALYDSELLKPRADSALNAATAYFRPLSGYSRGGHGDGNINSSDDPSWVDSAAGSTQGTTAAPVACTACHNDALATWSTTTGNGGMLHFPAPTTGNLHRLINTTIENGGHSSAGLCNSCHDGGTYPGSGTAMKHHPSYQGTYSAPSKPIVPATGQEILTAITSGTTWSNKGGGHYEQNAYGAGSTYSGDPDRFVNWWRSAYGTASQDPPPRPVFYGEDGNPATSTPSKAYLPLEQYILNTGTDIRVMCVTCHNPHGTDLYTFDSLGGHQKVPDNNMLRLRESDNTLCNACH